MMLFVQSFPASSIGCASRTAWSVMGRQASEVKYCGLNVYGIHIPAQCKRNQRRLIGLG